MKGEKRVYSVLIKTFLELTLQIYRYLQRTVKTLLAFRYNM